MAHYQLKYDDLAPLFLRKKEVEMHDIDKYLSHNLHIKNERISYVRYKLLKEGIIERIGYKKYSIRNSRTYYVPDLNELTQKIYTLIKQKKPFLKCCVWRTSVLNEFTRHQTGKFMIMVEVERIGVEPVFDVLRDNHENVFLNPTEKEIDFYISALDEAIVVVPLVSEAPTQEVNQVETITIEKLLVDILSEEKLYQSAQSERSRIIFEANSKYTINMNKLLRYASRRRKKEFIEQKINEVLAKDYLEK
jgi:hypothetical protein